MKVLQAGALLAVILAALAIAVPAATNYLEDREIARLYDELNSAKQRSNDYYDCRGAERKTRGAICEGFLNAVLEHREPTEQEVESCPGEEVPSECGDPADGLVAETAKRLKAAEKRRAARRGQPMTEPDLRSILKRAWEVLGMWVICVVLGTMGAMFLDSFVFLFLEDVVGVDRATLDNPVRACTLGSAIGVFVGLWMGSKPSTSRMLTLDSEQR